MTVHDRISPVAPYDLAASARGGDPTRRFRDGTLVLTLPEGVARVHQEAGGRLVLEANDEATLVRTRFVLGTDVDHRPFLAMVHADRALASRVARARGLRPLRTATVAHALVKAMCGQLIQASAAAAIERAILRLTSAADPVSPPREALVALGSARIASVGLAQRRADALVHVARTLDLERLHGHDTPAVIARLTREPQLGPWSAGVVATYGLGRPDSGLVGDLGLVRVARARFGPDAGVAETRALLAPYTGWEAFASLHIMSLDEARAGA